MLFSPPPLGLRPGLGGFQVHYEQRPHKEDLLSPPYPKLTGVLAIFFQVLGLSLRRWLLWRNSWALPDQQNPGIFRFQSSLVLVGCLLSWLRLQSSFPRRVNRRDCIVGCRRWQHCWFQCTQRPNKVLPKRIQRLRLDQWPSLWIQNRRPPKTCLLLLRQRFEHDPPSWAFTSWAQDGRWPPKKTFRLPAKLSRWAQAPFKLWGGRHRGDKKHVHQFRRQPGILQDWRGWSKPLLDPQRQEIMGDTAHGRLQKQKILHPRSRCGPHFTHQNRQVFWNSNIRRYPSRSRKSSSLSFR